jgi:hypothetical protein
VVPVSIAGLGIIQAAAAHNGLKGLLFFRPKIVTYSFTAVTLLPVLYYFFTWNHRNVTGVIEGAQQAGLFFLALVLSLICTLVVSSLINIGLKRPVKPVDGLDALKETTFFKTLQSWFSKSR